MNSPAVYQGEVVQPTHISQPHSYAAHDFFNTIRDLLHLVQFHNESQRLAALQTVTDYEKHVTGPDSAWVASDADRAAYEDVRLRVPPQTGLPALAPAQQIDYARLAAAIVAAQAAQKTDTHDPTPPGQVPDISSMGQSQVRVPGA